MTASDYRFARRPKWLAGHLIVVVALVGFLLAGFWQLSRLDERRTTNAAIEARAGSDPVALPSIESVTADPGEFEWVRVEFDADWITDQEVLLRAQSLDGISGHDVLTPALVDGTAVVVNRGWVPIDVEDPPVAIAAPEAPITRVEGVLRLSQQRGSFGPIDPDDGVLRRIARVDLERLEPQISGRLYPVWVQLLGQSPAQPEFPRTRPLPDLGEGPHLSYAVQWFLFAGVVVVGYPVLLRRTARSRPAERRRHP